MIQIFIKKYAPEEQYLCRNKNQNNEGSPQDCYLKEFSEQIPNQIPQTLKLSNPLTQKKPTLFRTDSN